MSEDHRTVLITGAASGIGAATTRYLSERGFFVYATDKNIKALEQFSKTKNVSTIRIDVTDKDDLNQAFDLIQNTKNELYGLVNSAGVIKLGPVIEAPIEELELQLKINVIGMSLVTRTFFPLIMRSKGRIINISSAAGRFVSPFYGFYSMSKMAVEAFSDALRRELKPFGIQISIIQPGLVDTALWDRAYDPDQYKSSIFKYRLDKFIKFSVYDSIPKAVKPEKIAHSIFRALSSKRPKTRYFISKGKLRQIFAENLPTKWIDFIISLI